MICFPNAKINLGLNIVSKREDGYHDLETVFYPIGIKDALEIIPSKADCDSFFESGMKTGALPVDNLVIKALCLMRENYEIPPLEIHLLKKIPFGAGIGGGSADATFMLKLLNDMFDLGINDEGLANLALQLGADCPFFIYNRPMFAQGVGERLEDISLTLDSYYLVLVKPDIHIPTRDAFASIAPRHPDISLRDIIKFPVSEWCGRMHNDFENSIFPKYSGVRDIKDKLYNLGALYASMSGSGSSVYGIFNEEPVGIDSEFPGYFVWKEVKE